MGPQTGPQSIVINFTVTPLEIRDRDRYLKQRDERHYDHRRVPTKLAGVPPHPDITPILLNGRPNAIPHSRAEAEILSAEATLVATSGRRSVCLETFPNDKLARDETS
jgi:hypothetical protein